jgi:MFS family permease
MQTAANDLPAQQGPSTPPDWPSHPQIETREPRNLLLLAAHQIVLRVGWIFKTESVIMPAFIDRVVMGLVSPPVAGALRGCLPVLNRLGQSVPPVFSAEPLKATPYKKRALAAFTLLMSLPFAVLSIVWSAVGGGGLLWVAALFLALYFAFFVFNGLYHVSFGTVQGKLIRPTRRGHLLLISTGLGTVPAMLFALWWLEYWLERPDGGFAYIFGVTAVCFFLSGLTALLLFEPADDTPRKKTQIRRSLSHVWHGLRRNLTDTGHVLRRDRNLRRLVLVTMLFGSGLMVFPHYQALAMGPLKLPIGRLMVFVIVQNAAVGICSLLVGPLADAFGNRLTLRTLIFGAAIAPLLAVFLLQIDQGTGGKLFYLVFIPLGVTPLVLRILINYTLEICRPAEHPRYLSTVNLCLAAPFVFSPVVGLLVEVVGYPTVFLSAAGLIALGGCLTFRLAEPRHRGPGDEIAAASVTADE